MVGYPFTLLESYERGRKKDERRKERSLFPYFAVFEKFSPPYRKRRKDKRKKKREIQHHRYDRRVSKQLCYRLVKRFLSDLRAHCCLILFSICFPPFFSFFFCLFNSLFNSELCQSTCFGNEKQTKKKKDKIKKEENIY